MTNKSLKNKKIIISAGASGIGLATAKVCLSRGATVYLCDLNGKFISNLKKHPLKNRRLFVYKYDASNERDVSNFFEDITSKRKPISDRECIYKCLDNCISLAGLDKNQVERLAKQFNPNNPEEVDIKSEYPPL